MLCRRAASLALSLEHINFNGNMNDSTFYGWIMGQVMSVCDEEACALHDTSTVCHSCCLHTDTKKVQTSICKGISHVCVVAKIVCVTVLESISIFHCVPDIMSHLYLPMYLVLFQGYILYAQMSPSYCSLIQTSNIMPSPSLPSTPPCYLLLPLPDLFLLVYYFGFLLTPSQAAVLFCFKTIYHSYQTKVCPRLCNFSNANNHCHCYCHHTPPPHTLFPCSNNFLLFHS
jgi:hypothetical protein